MGFSIAYSLMVGGKGVGGHRGKLLAQEVTGRMSQMDWSSSFSKVCVEWEGGLGLGPSGRDPWNHMVSRQWLCLTLESAESRSWTVFLCCFSNKSSSRGWYLMRHTG